MKSPEMKITIYSSACYSIYCTIPLRSVGSNLTLTLGFHGNLSYFLFILHCYKRIYIYIYIYHVGYVYSVCTSIVLKGYITNLLTLKLRGLHSDSDRRSFALQSDVLFITPSDPEALSDIFGYILAFSLISIHYTKRPGSSL